MGDRATLLETGRFVQKHAEEGRDVVDAEETADAEMEARHRSGAESGETASMSVLGALLLRRGDLDGAERWLRAATGEGDRAAANNLGVLLHQRGYADEAAKLVAHRRCRGLRRRGPRAGQAPPGTRRRARC